MDNLDIDMIRCNKDGFSYHYGKWKAMQKPKEIKPKQTKQQYEYTCLCCGNTILARTKQVRKYCDRNCQRQYISNKKWEERKKK